jgi:hypothetical protein
VTDKLEYKSFVGFGIESFNPYFEEIERAGRSPVKIRINKNLHDKLLSDHCVKLQNKHIACYWGIPLEIDDTVIGFEIDYN